MFIVYCWNKEKSKWDYLETIGLNGEDDDVLMEIKTIFNVVESRCVPMRFFTSLIENKRFENDHLCFYYVHPEPLDWLRDD